jgi:hypothetical protein
VEWQKTPNPASRSSCVSQPVMPAQTQSGLVAVSLKFLAFSALIVADSKASPILQTTIGARGMGITSSDEDRMTTKVGNPNCYPRNPREQSDESGHDFRTFWNGCLPLRLWSWFVPSSCGGWVQLHSSRTPTLIHRVACVGYDFYGLATGRFKTSSRSSKLHSKGEACIRAR